MPQYLTVSAAYGRTYKSLKAAQADWNADKDFVIRDLMLQGKMINRSDAQRGNFKVMVRYDSDRKIGQLK